MIKNTNEQLINLDEKDFIGKGCDHRCYIHPTNDLLCVKIYYNPDKKHLYGSLNYNKNMLKKQCFSSVLPKYYGEIQTNMGVGYVYDLIRDYDGNISNTLRHYLLSKDLLKNNLSEFARCLKILQTKMIEDRVITNELVASNILYQKESENSGKLVIVDNLGCVSRVPLEYYFDFAACYKIKKRWRKFFEHLKYRYTNTSLIAELVKKSGLDEVKLGKIDIVLKCFDKNG